MEDLRALDRIACFAALDVRFIVTVVVGLQESLNLLCEEGEEVGGMFGCHEFVRDGNFGLGEGESGVAVQLDGTDSEVCSAEIDCKVKSL